MQSYLPQTALGSVSPWSVQYPSYVSLDGFIDLERLRSLDNYLRDKITKRILDDGDDFFVNQHCLDKSAPYKPGVREVWLTRTAPETPYDYLNINKCELWQPTPEASEFTLLMDFINTLPFAATGRILLIYDAGENAVPAHRDHESENICHEFMWFRTNLKKPFYLLNQHTGDKQYVSGYSAWFDTVNQYHGSDAAAGLNYSFRVDGVFTAEFRDRIPHFSASNSATPSLWAASGGQLL